MRSLPTLKRWLAAAATVSVFVAIVLIAGLNREGNSPAPVMPSTQAGKADWLMFGGTPQRNMVNLTAKNIPVEWSIEEGKEKNILWSADLGSKAYGGPIVANGRILVGTNNQKPRDPKLVEVVKGKKKPIDMGIIMCFKESDGSFLWQNAFEKLKAGRVQDWPKEGICSTPLVEGDRVYYVSNRCEVVCVDLDGKDLWPKKLDMIGELGVFPHNLAVCSPLIVGDYLFIVTANGVDEGHINVPAPKAPSFIKVDKRNGKVLWKDNAPTIKLTEVAKDGGQEAFFKRLVNRGDLIQHGQWSNPAYAVVKGQAQVIFPGGEGKLYSYDPNDPDPKKKPLWIFDCNPKDALYELEGKGTRNDFIATPVIHDDKVYIGVGQDPEHLNGVGHLWCIDMTKRGDVSPELVTDYSVYPPKTKPNPNSAMVWHHGGFTSDGKGFVFGRTMSTCAIHEGLCYVAELSGILNCLDAKTGRLYWSHNTGAAVWSSPAFIDGKVYMGTDEHVWVFAHGKEKKVLAKNDTDSPIRATPIVANGILYVMNENRLFAIGTKK